MSEFNNTKLRELIKEFGFKEGNMEDFYFHPQDKRKMKPILTKRAVIAIQVKREFVPQDPAIQEVANRVAVSGFWRTKDSKRFLWTTGEANPGGKSVEGSHPVAMAEKRWKARGIIALECGEGSGVYSEEEFTADYLKEARGKAATPPTARPMASEVPLPAAPPSAPAEPPAPAHTPRWVESLPEEWENACARVSEATGLSRAEFEVPLLRHVGIRYSQAKNQLRTPPHASFQDLIDVGAAFALECKKHADSIGQQLLEGISVSLEQVGPDEQEKVEALRLVPTAF